MSVRPTLSAPSEAQTQAADPALSAWVGANAGSGKTRVLTERVARLLLDGARPEAILCLTYTKAAAVEMQRRLFALLGGWAMAEDGVLAEALAALTGGRRPGAERIARARRLFARALETPGGLKIQTIHAFCEALLRRFPLESGLSPRFRVIDDRARALMLRQIRAEMALDAETGRDAAFDAAAARVADETFDDLVKAVLERRSAFRKAGDGDAIDAVFGPETAGGPADVAAAAMARLGRAEWEDLSALTAAMEATGAVNDAKRAALFREALAYVAEDPLRSAAALGSALLTAKGTPVKAVASKAARTACPMAEELVPRLQAWAVETAEALCAAENAARARDLRRFATSLLERYAAAKQSRALADFDDLIERAEALLTDPALAPWVLYRLDGRIEHILVDEAQDTAPGQWRLIEAIAAEFHAGESARPEGARPRTLFVVGDEKQSIYSFQGAEPAMFGEMRGRFAERIEGAGGALARPALVTSFRSAPGILRFVDRVFEGREAALSPSGDRVRHAAHRSGDGARVDLWPLVGDEPAGEMPNWWEPVAARRPLKARPRLARLLAAEIARMIAEEQRPARDGEPPRPVRAGDILVLVRRRDALATELIRALKREGVPVAGADRLKLAAGLAVQDLMALIRVSLMPSDDLALAAVLRSPLCSVDEAALFALAHGREGWLIEALQAAEDHAEDAAMIADMAGRADYLRPYEFLERALIHHDGRRRLVARLGPEAEDLIDELLGQALSYEAREIPTLAGFVAWIEAADVEVKREMEAAADAVRVMTVHGAKGLEAPIVILPDTVQMRAPRTAPVLPVDGGGNRPGAVLWMPAKTADDAVTGQARALAMAREQDESQRLLYVALTRAEDWLILCGAGEEKEDRADWYGQLSDAAAALGARAVAGGPSDALTGAVLRLETEPDAAEAPLPELRPRPATEPERPEWLAPAAKEARATRRTPSELLPDAQQAHAGTGRGRAEALRHGRAVHLLLERLSRMATEARPGAAERLLRRAEPELDADARRHALAEAEAVFAAPFSGTMFGAGSHAEAGLALHLPKIADGPMIGRIDRLVIAPERLLIVDFKTDRDPPERAEDVPAGYLAQLGAYRVALSARFPDRPVEAALLWSAIPRLMPLPARLMEDALTRSEPVS